MSRFHLFFKRSDADSSEDKSWGVKGVEKDYSYRWGSRTHDPKVAGSNPAPATNLSFLLALVGRTGLEPAAP